MTARAVLVLRSSQVWIPINSRSCSLIYVDSASSHRLTAQQSQHTCGTWPLSRRISRQVIARVDAERLIGDE
jgi:hypothetical protein